MDADSSYGGSDTAQDSHSAHENSANFDPHNSHHDVTTTAVHSVPLPVPESPPNLYYHKNEVTLPIHYDETDYQNEKNLSKPKEPHYLSTANLNIKQSLENHSNLEEMSKNYRSTSYLNEDSPESVKKDVGIENPAFDEDDHITNGKVKSTFDNSKPYNGDMARGLSTQTNSEEPMAEAVNLELINLKPVGKDVAGPYENDLNGVSGIPVKKEDDAEIGNPYDEYFVPVNEHRKYMSNTRKGRNSVTFAESIAAGEEANLANADDPIEYPRWMSQPPRGEKLYLTMDKRNKKSRNKCLCWTICLCIVAAALIIGILAAVGVIGNQGPMMPKEITARHFDGTEAEVKGAGVFGSSDSKPPPENLPVTPGLPISTVSSLLPSTDTSFIEVPRALESAIVIDNMEYSDELANRNSTEYKALAASIEEELKKSLFANDVLKYGSADIEIKVIDFLPGSVVARYRVAWKFKEGIHNAQDPINEEMLVKKINNILERKHSLMDTYHLANRSITAQKIMDLCQIQNNGCEHLCMFDYTNLLDFICTCPEGKILAENGKNCVQAEEPIAEPEPASQPESSAEPEPSANPETSPEPVANPETSPEPETSAEPIPSAEPVPSSEPEPTAEPEPSSEPEPAVKPEITAEPEPSAEPEPTAEPVAEQKHESEPAAEPEPSVEPQTTSEPESNVDHKSDQHVVISASESEPTSLPDTESKTESEDETKYDQAHSEHGYTLNQHITETEHSTEHRPIIEPRFSESTSESEFKSEKTEKATKYQKELSSDYYHIPVIISTDTDITTQQTLVFSSEPTADLALHSKSENKSSTESSTEKPFYGEVRHFNHEHDIFAEDTTNIGPKYEQNTEIQLSGHHDDEYHFVNEEATYLEPSTEKHLENQTERIVEDRPSTEREKDQQIVITNENITESSQIRDNHNETQIVTTGAPKEHVETTIHQILAESEHENGIVKSENHHNYFIPVIVTHEETTALPTTTARKHMTLMENGNNVVETTTMGLFSEEKMHQLGIVKVVTPEAEVFTTNSPVTERQSNTTTQAPVDDKNEMTTLSFSAQDQDKMIMGSVNAVTTTTTTESVELAEKIQDQTHNDSESKTVEITTTQKSTEAIEHVTDSAQQTNHTHQSYQTDHALVEHMSPFLPEIENDTLVNILHSDEHFIGHPYVINDTESHEIIESKPPSLEHDQLNYTNPFDPNPTDTSSLKVVPLEKLQSEENEIGEGEGINGKYQSIDKEITKMPPNSKNNEEVTTLLPRNDGHNINVQVIGTIDYTTLMPDQENITILPDVSSSISENSTENKITTLKAHTEDEKITLPPEIYNNVHSNSFFEKTLKEDTLTSSTKRPEEITTIPSIPDEKVIISDGGNKTEPVTTTSEGINNSTEHNGEEVTSKMEILNANETSTSINKENDNSDFIYKSVTQNNKPNVIDSSTEDLVAMETTTYDLKTEDATTLKAVKETTTVAASTIIAEHIETVTEMVNLVDKEDSIANSISDSVKENSKNITTSTEKVVINIHIKEEPEITTENADNSTSLPAESITTQVTEMYKVKEVLADITTTERLFLTTKSTTASSLNAIESEEDLSVAPLDSFNTISEEEQSVLDKFRTHEVDKHAESNEKNDITEDKSKYEKIDSKDFFGYKNKIEKEELSTTDKIITTQQPEIVSSTFSNAKEIKPVTEDFTLFSFPRCSSSQFQCVNGTAIKDGSYCIAANDRCDSVSDCSDGSDEIGCMEEGCPNNFKCANGQCLKRHLVCDGIVNCNDGSDEANCDDWTCNFDELACKTGKRCVPLSWKCDGRAQCPDSSDERNCHMTQCQNNSFHCSEQDSCIPESWRCDGKSDCANGEDEKLCECSMEQFKCQTGGGCIDKTLRCDGIPQCADRSDEWQCLSLGKMNNIENVLQIQFENNTFYPVCLDEDNWNSTYADMACQNLGYAGAVNLKPTEKPEGNDLKEYYILDVKAYGLPILSQLTRKEGTCSKVATLTCQEFACGSNTHERVQQARIIGGNKAAATQWPSLTLLYDKKRNIQCTSTLIAPMWAVASYSCVASNDNTIPDSKEWVLFAGSTNFFNTADNSSTQMGQIKEIIPHPQTKYSHFEFINDVVLIRLAKPFVLGRNVSTVCLPDKDIEPRQLCVLSGWGINKPGDPTKEQYLYYLPVPVIENGDCNSTKHYNGLMNPDKICAGYTDSEKTPCYNDEGAPLMCFSEVDNRWELHGLLSHHENCGVSKHPAVYSSLNSKLRRWITNTIGEALNKST